MMITFDSDPDENCRIACELLVEEDWPALYADLTVFACLPPRERFREHMDDLSDPQFRARCHGMWRRYKRFVRKARLPDSDKMCFGNLLMETLGQ